MIAARQADVAPRAVRPPRAMVWVVLLAMSGAVVVVGIVATFLVFARLGSTPLAPWGFWVRFLAACALTFVSLSIRSIRWIFLLRRAETRIPIRDAYIGYFAGLSLLFTPFLIGEIAVRAYINRVRGGVPVLTTAVVNVWERAMDVLTLAFVAGSVMLMSGSRPVWAYVAAAGLVVSAVPRLRRMALQVAIAVLAPIASRFAESGDPPVLDRLATAKVWWTGLAATLVAWLLPGIGLWLLAAEWQPSWNVVSAELTYAHSALAGGVLFAPGGVLIAGADMLTMLAAHGMGETAAALTVLGDRLATVGLSVALGVLFVGIHWRSAARRDAHFDAIADAYDVQIPESRRLALLQIKTSLMREIISARGVGVRGLDVGCGQGAYVGRMRALGFDVKGIDASPGQVQLAAKNVRAADLVQVGSVLDIPAAHESFDFAYVINVLHHLGSLEDQRCAFKELFRILKPGGLLFVHEINTRNMFFRFYMGYVFPSLNCIDEGVERWLRADRMGQYTEAPVVDVRYFTFLPDFIPQGVVRVLRPIEAALERSSVRMYSAHYMAVLEKPARS